MIKPKGPAPSAPKGSTTAFCGCGYSRPIPPGEKNPNLRCPTCGNLMAVDLKPAASGKKVQLRTNVSAPLLPLHVKPIVKTQVKKGARFFPCICGMRIMISAGSEGSRIQCPECDRFHVLEPEAAPAPPPQPSRPQPREAKPPRVPAPAPKPPPPPAAPSRALGLGEFLCECGEIQPPRTSRTGRDFACKKCGRKGRVETDKDPQTGLPKMRAVFTSGPTAPAPPPPPPLPSAPPPLPVAPPSAGEVSFEELEPVEAVFAAAEGSAADLPPTVDADAQVVPCACGAEILLSAGDVGHTIRCPACADTMVVEGTTDARTGAVAITLKVVGALDDPDWKLEEFQ